MTPVGIPMDYLKKLCEAGQVADIPGALTVANCTPCFPGARPLLQKDEIEAMEMSYLKMDREARMSGSWEGYLPDGVIFEHFKDEMISDVPPPPGDWMFAIGIDHGSEPGAEFAVLIGVLKPKQSSKETPFCYVLDEYSSGAATAEIHARGILAMLSRNNLELADLFRITGDRSHSGDRYGGRMSNNMLRSAMENVLGYPRQRLPTRIHTAYKPRFSVYYGTQVVSELMARGRFQIHPRCRGLIKSLKNWALKKSGRMDTLSSFKHAVDALRYALLPCVSDQYRAPRVSKIPQK